MNNYPTQPPVSTTLQFIVFSCIFLFAGIKATGQNTVSGTVYNDMDGSAKGTFNNIQTGGETGTNGNGTLWVYVVKALNDEILATAAVAPNGTYTSSSYSTNGQNRNIYLLLDTVTRTVGNIINLYNTIKMPAAWSNTSPYMTATIDNGGSNLINQHFGIQKNGFLTIPDFSVCSGSDSLFTWYFRGGYATLFTGVTVIENSGTSEKLPFFKVTARYFTNNDTYSTLPDIYSPSTYTIATSGGLEPIPTTLQYHNPVLEMSGSSLVNGFNNDSIGISVAFKNTNGQKMYIQKINTAVLDLDTYESLKVIGFNNGTEVKPVIYASNGYADNTTNDMRSFYMGNRAWIFGVSSGFQSPDPCNAWCDYNYNAVTIIEFPTAVDSVFFTARITEPTGNRGYLAGSLGSNEITSFNYCPVTLQGNLWNDANGNGIIDGAEANVLSNGYFINMLDEYGRVLATAPIQPDGSYTFSHFPQLATTSTMKLQIAATAGAIGSLPPATAVPGGYVSVSENQDGITETGILANKEIALPLLLSSNLTNYNFGIEQPPVSTNVTQSIAQPSAGTISMGSINTNVDGSDPEDGLLGNSNTIVITQLPANATVYYNGNPISLNQSITNFNPALLAYTGITNGSTSVIFRYAFLDAALVQGSSANYTVNWLTSLPINLENFTAVANNCNSAAITWKVSEAINFSHFEIERSSNGIDFATAGTISFNVSITNYGFNDFVDNKGFYQYRLKLVDMDGQNRYSPVATLRLDCKEERTIQVFPNPSKDKITISGLQGGEQLIIYNVTGQVVYTGSATGYQWSIDINSLVNGIYYLVVANKDGVKTSVEKLIKTE